MCRFCDNFNTHEEIAFKINAVLLEAAIPIEQGIAVMLYLCGLIGACPADIDAGAVVDRSVPYEPGYAEGQLKELAFANIEAAYSRTQKRERLMRTLRKGGLTH